MQTDPQYKLRLPADLKEKIKQASEENHRSMNAEIVARLQESFDEENTYTSSVESPDLTEEVRRELLASMIAEMVEERLLKQMEEREKSKKA
nr:Arc family DNA-binding protein [Halomonas sp.]